MIDILASPITSWIVDIVLLLYISRHRISGLIRRRVTNRPSKPEKIMLPGQFGATFDGYLKASVKQDGIAYSVYGISERVGLYCHKEWSNGNSTHFFLSPGEMIGPFVTGDVADKLFEQMGINPATAQKLD